MELDSTPHARQMPADQAGSFLFKPPLTYADQATLLLQRGLSFGTLSQAAVEESLAQINYYRLRGYWMTLVQGDRFIPGTTFADVLGIHEFDCELRQVVAGMCERIELKFRTSFAYHSSHRVGPDILYRPEAFRDGASYQKSRQVLDAEIHHARRGHVPCVLHNMEKYGALPIWAAVEILPFGTISRMFGNLDDKRLRAEIARDFGASAHNLKSWVEHLSSVRNICAHHNRLYNRIYTKKPLLYPEHRRRFANDGNFSTLLVLAYLYRRISIEEYLDSVAKLAGLLQRYPMAEMAKMGFPSDWGQILRDAVLQPERASRDL